MTITAMSNKAMARKLELKQAIDVSSFERTAAGDYILPSFEASKDYCDAMTEQWIWSIGREDGGRYLASTTTKFYQNPNFECVWLR